MSAHKRWIVFREIPRLDLLIFASVEIAVHEDAIYSALCHASTWGELRSLMPAAEWSAITRALVEREDGLEDENRSHWDDDNAPFVRDQVPGYAFGDYPPVRSEWLGSVEEFPTVLSKAHNILDDEAGRAIHWQIPLECGETVATLLREWGYVVERADFLEFC